MTGTTMPIGEWPDEDLYAYPDERGAPAGQPVDPLLDSIYEDIAAVTRGLVEIRRLADYLGAELP